MPTRSSKSKDHDFAVKAREVFEQGIGEHLDGTPLENPDEGKNPHAIAVGRMGGKKGGKAQPAKPSPRRRSQSPEEPLKHAGRVRFKSVRFVPSSESLASPPRILLMVQVGVPKLM